MTRRFEVVVAADQDRGIGKAGTLPWRLPADLAHFRAITTGAATVGVSNTVIMGRLTWESLPARFRPLAGRRNVVVTRTPIAADDVPTALTLDAALALATAGGTAFVIGGSRLFDEAFRHPRLTRIHLTEIDGHFDCDVFMPPLPGGFTRDDGDWQREGDLRFRFVTLDRAA